MTLRDDLGADRAEAMGRRLERTARRLGMDVPGRVLLERAFRAAMEPRRAQLQDHHPDYLHPARTALILMDDCGVVDPVVLAAAMLAETRDASLAVDNGVVEGISAGAARSLRRLPSLDGEGDRLLESLLALAPEDAMIAAAERLDHARHLHLRDREEWARYHATTCSTYAPVATRANPRLAQRLHGWCSTFRRRFLDP